MYIHKSHSKKDIMNVIKRFNLDIVNSQKYKKIELSALVVNQINLLNEIEPCSDLCIFNLIDLINYLQSCNPKKLLTIKEKNNIIMQCKRLKHYCINNFNINFTDFNDIEELYNIAFHINNYGDIPSVRKTIKLLMNDPNKIRTLRPIISPIVQKELDKKMLYKKISYYKMEVKYGKYFIDFN